MKKLVSILLALNLCLAISIPAFAANPTPTSHKANAEAVTRAEQTKWCYRIYNGERQKRLWSITNNCWLTEWMPYNA